MRSALDVSRTLGHCGAARPATRRRSQWKETLVPSRPSRPRKPTAGERAKAASDAHKTVARNRKATHDYFIEDRYEAGLVLTGTEVKALRMGRASLTEAWIEIDRHGEAWLQGAHIPEYLQGTWNNHSPRRKRKLLLHRAQLERLAQRVSAKGYTVVPLELYFLGGRAKIEIALARGKQDWDKRQSLREAQDRREAARAMAWANRRRG
jgi:ssrA-binding protein